VLSIIFLGILGVVSAVPAPWGIAINEQTNECAGYWAGDEYGNNPLPVGWEDIYSWSENWTKIGNFSECYLNSTSQGPYFTNDSKICCEKNGYKFVSKNIGLGKDIEDNTNASCKNLYWIDNTNKECGQKQFCGAYMYLGLQTFESKEQCLKALDIECVADFDCPQLDCVDNDCIGASPICIGGSCVEDLSNGRKAEVKIMPETASQNAIQRLGELNFTIQLKEVGKGNDSKVVYELTGNKQGKFLGIFKIMAKVQAQVDAGTGETEVIKPWWSFLASGI